MLIRTKLIDRILKWDSLQNDCETRLLEIQDAIEEAQKPGKIAWGQHIYPPDYREEQIGIYGTSSATQALSYSVSEGQQATQRTTHVQQGQAWLVDQWFRDDSLIADEKEDKEILYKHVFCLNALGPGAKTLDDISDTDTTFYPDTSGLTIDISGFDDIEEYAKNIADQLWEKRIEWSDVNRPAWGEFYRGPSEHDEAQVLPTALALYALTRSQEHTGQAEFTEALRTLANRVNRETAGQNSNPSTNIEKRLIELSYTILALCNYRDVRGNDTEKDIHNKIQSTIENLQKTVSQVPEINIETYYKRFYSVPGNQRPERYKLLPIYPNIALAFMSAGPKFISSNYVTISRIVKKYLHSVENYGVYDSYEVGFEATLNQYWISKLFYEFTQIDTSRLQLRRIVWQLGKRLIASRIVILLIAVLLAWAGAYLRSLEGTSVWLRTVGFLCYLLAGAVLRELGILGAVRSIWGRLT